MTVLFVGPVFPDLPTLEKEVKVIDLPLPDEREVAAWSTSSWAPGGAPRRPRHERPRHPGGSPRPCWAWRRRRSRTGWPRPPSASRGSARRPCPCCWTRSAASCAGRGRSPTPHPEPADHLAGYPHLRRLLQEAVTFSPAARAFGVEPMKGPLLVGLPGTGKDLTKKIAASVLGAPCSTSTWPA